MRTVRHALPSMLLLAAGAGCEPPIPATTERIIRIQIEGCEEAPAAAASLALVAGTAPVPAAVATADDPPATTEVTALQTPVAVQTRVPRTPIPAPRTPEALAADYTLRREGFLATMAERRLGAADVSEGWSAYRRADDFFRQRNFDEALRYIEVATLEARSTRIGEPFLSKKFTRVESRIAAATLSAAEKAAVSRRISQANQAFLNNQFDRANRILYEIEQGLDARAQR